MKASIPFTILSILLISLGVQAQESKKKLEKIKVVGSRIEYKTSDEASVPVEIINEKDIAESGISETGKLIQSLSASFNFSYTTVSDGTDIVRPATLRGMQPDQVLVLVNGKRRHAQALVNVQQTIGRGASGTDINSIPVTAIESIQILRDGAAAQYGSDAIAGVVNIILKGSKASGNEANFYTGQNFLGDGLVNQINLGHNIDLGRGGMRVSADVRLRGESNRADIDEKYGRRTMRIGEAKSDNYSVFLNGDYPMGSTGELYVFGGATRRNGESAGVFREPDGDRNFKSIYPNGFLPLLITTVEDQSMTAGFKFDVVPDWTLDNSLSWGRNSFNYRSQNSINVSLGENSPTSTDDGTLIYQEFNYNMDLTGEIDIGLTNTINVAVGAAVRAENYEIQEGEFASYAYGPTNDLSQVILNQNGTKATPGIQGFPGFQPSDSGQTARNSQAIYADAESFLTDEWQLGLAARGENYEGVGQSTIGKLSSRYNFTSSFAIRGAVSTGFRAPSLQQANFSTHSTTLAANNTFTETQTAAQGSPSFRALNLPNLKNESSFNTTAGVVIKPTKASQITVDVYSVDIQDRIALSGMLTPEDAATCAPDLSNCPIKATLDPLNVGAVQFFTNAIDTKTEGLDLVMSHNMYWKGVGMVRAFTSAHFNQTRVTGVRDRGDIPSNVVFGEEQVTLVEQGQPRQRYVIGLDYTTGKWNFNTRVNYYGSVAGRGFSNYYQKFSGEWITDFSTQYNFSKNFAVIVGANNLFNVFPDELDAAHPVRQFARNSFRYSWETAPFGYNGGFYYTKIAYTY